MKAYLVADIEVLETGVYEEYVRAAQPIVLQHGGRYLVRGGSALPVCGDWNPKRLLIIEFDSLSQLQGCFGSEEYKRIAPLRLASTRSRSVIVEGTPDAG
ncbi:MAG: DUF1330 domain-containing protein [Acidobacteriales bacterium]|nr:DUF1330 domain-containing protein [Terriglobales bacterium]